MNAPVTTLDGRFSDPTAIATTWDAARQELEDAELSWITTVRPDGRPNVSPLVAVWLDDALHFCTGSEEQKAVNLRENQHVVLTTGCNTWQDGLDVTVEGVAVLQTDPAVLERLASVWGRKWDGRWQYTVRAGAFRPSDGDDPALVFSVRPTKVLAFGKGTFSQTRHKFA
jgi:general stress protein 26